jgi:hypothetical protein
MGLHSGSGEPATEYWLGQERSVPVEARCTIGSGPRSGLA